MDGKKVTINSLEELVSYASECGNTITMSPGVYDLTDYLPAESMAARHSQELFQYVTFSGNNNVFHLEGVEVVVDTDLRDALNPPIHTSEFLVSGSGNTHQHQILRARWQRKYLDWVLRWITHTMSVLGSRRMKLRRCTNT